MSTEPTNYLIPAGAVVAALIAGLFSFFNLVLSKEQKLSELRQAWIDGLRDDLATCLAAVSMVEYLGRIHRSSVGLSNAAHEPHMNVTASFTRILLRLNPSDKSAAQTQLILELNILKEHFNASRFEEAVGCISKIREQGQLVLKAEWERVKQGEPTFRWSKRIALLVLLAAVALGGLLAVEIHSNTGAGPAHSQSLPDKGIGSAR